MKAAMLGTWHVHTEGYAKEFCSDPRCSLAAVWDPDRERAESFARKFSCVPYTDLSRLFAEGDFDSVIVCSATSEHVPLMVRAAEAGKNIFTEKVLAITSAGAEEICRAVKKSGVNFVISYPHKTNPGLRYAKKMIDSGALGKITYARVRNAHDGSLAGWLPPHFYDRGQCGGGAMMDLGAHPMYTLLWLLGEPEKVSSAFTTVTGKPVEDNAVSILTYANGAIGVSETGFVSSFGNYVLEVVGTEGAVRIVDGQTETTNRAAKGKWQPAELLPAPESPMNQWIRLVIDHVPAPEFGVEEAVRLSRLMEAAYRASEQGICAAY
jgi:1,5-anhydro-D-fructose reductase (1,5-anhydro-D-mannitol-forming)